MHWIYAVGADSPCTVHSAKEIKRFRRHVHVGCNSCDWSPRSLCISTYNFCFISCRCGTNKDKIMERLKSTNVVVWTTHNHSVKNSARWPQNWEEKFQQTLVCMSTSTEEDEAPPIAMLEVLQIKLTVIYSIKLCFGHHCLQAQRNKYVKKEAAHCGGIEVPLPISVLAV